MALSVHGAWTPEPLPALAEAPGHAVTAFSGSPDALVMAVATLLPAPKETSVWVTVDGVRNWQIAAHPWRGEVTSLATRGGMVFVTTPGGGGRTELWSTPINPGPWSVVSLPGAGPAGIVKVLSDGAHVYATDGAAWWSSPNGRSWSPVERPGEVLAVASAHLSSLAGGVLWSAVYHGWPMAVVRDGTTLSLWRFRQGR